MNTYTSIGLNTAHADRLVSKIRQMDLFPTAVDSNVRLASGIHRQVTITVENVTEDQEQTIDSIEWHITHS